MYSSTVLYVVEEDDESEVAPPEALPPDGVAPLGAAAPEAVPAPEGAPLPDGGPPESIPGICELAGA
jgi:hypothetical protein